MVLGDVDSQQVRSRSYIHVHKDETTGMNSRKLCILKRAYFLSRYMGFLTQLQAQGGKWAPLKTQVLHLFCIAKSKVPFKSNQQLH
jgi:hypothetical protein